MLIADVHKMRAERGPEGGSLCLETLRRLRADKTALDELAALLEMVHARLLIASLAAEDLAR